MDKHKHELVIDLPRDASLRLDLQTTAPLNLIGIDSEGEFPLGVVKPRRGPQRVRQRFHGLSAVKVLEPKKGPFLAAYSVSQGKTMEPHDPHAPLPEPPQPKNLLQRMRQEFRQSLGVTREAFLDDTGLPGYELDDEDPGLFEEEMAEQQKQTQEASGRKGTSPTDPQTSPSPQQGEKSGNVETGESAKSDPTPSAGGATSDKGNSDA